MTNGARRGRKNFVRTAAAFVGVTAAILLLLIVIAHGLPRATDSPEIQAVLREALEDGAARAKAFEKARNSAFPNASMGPDWNFADILKPCNGPAFRSVELLISCHIETPMEIGGGSMRRIRRLASDDSLRIGPKNDPFRFPLDLRKCSKNDMLDQLCPYLRNLETLAEIETGLKLGLCANAVNAYHNPRTANLVGIATLFAGRAACELRCGETDNALETLASGYHLAAMLPEWPHMYSQIEREAADDKLDLVLWQLADTVPIDPAAQERILAIFDTRKSSGPLLKALRYHAAGLEIGQESDFRGYPKPVDLGFAFTGRGTFARAKMILPLLELPPWKAAAQLEPVRKSTFGGYWTNWFCANAITSYKIHARGALTADIARLAFALKAWKREHHAYPSAITDLTPFPLPEMPKEPLTGEPIKYESSGQTFVFSGPADGDLPYKRYWVARD